MQISPARSKNLHFAPDEAVLFTASHRIGEPNFGPDCFAGKIGFEQFEQQIDCCVIALIQTSPAREAGKNAPCQSSGVCGAAKVQRVCTGCNVAPPADRVRNQLVDWFSMVVTCLVSCSGVAECLAASRPGPHEGQAAGYDTNMGYLPLLSVAAGPDSACLICRKSTASASLSRQMS